MKFRAISLSLLMAWSVVLAGRAAQRTDLDIYTDGMVNGFQAWDWAVPTLANTNPVHTGKYSFSVSATGWQGIFIHHESLDTTGYESLNFWLHGGPEGGQILRVKALLGTNAQAGFQLPALASNRWQEFTVPLSMLGVADKTNLQSLWMQLLGDSPTNTFYLDDLRLVAERPPPPPAPPPPVQVVVTAPPQSASGGTSVVLWIGSALVVIIGLLAALVFTLRGGAGSAPEQPSGHSPTLRVSGAGGKAELPPGGSGNALTETNPSVPGLPAGALPELTEFAKQDLVQGLYSQRNAIIEHQRRAQLELADLEGRLASLQLPLQGRIQAYEQRIAELEKILLTRDEEMRGLTLATLALVRQKLEDEKGREREGTRFN